jgi:hypothetical protein
MKSPAWFQLSVLICLAATGCESVSAVRERIAARDEAKTRIYAAQPHATYVAVRTAAVDMGYRFLRGGPAQGEFEAISAVRQGDNRGSARQVSMKVGLRATPDGAGTEVTVRLREILEADSSNRAGQATEGPLRDTPQYDVFFRRVGAVLGVPAQEDANRRGP